LASADSRLGRCLSRLSRSLKSTTFEGHADFDALFPADPRAALTDLMSGAIGTPFKLKRNSSVYAVATAQGTCYLKRSEHQGPRSILRHLLRGNRAHTDCGWEYQSILTLRSLEYRVAEPLAFGEEAWLKLWPTRGFLLVRKVVGLELHELWTSTDSPRTRVAVMHSLGAYIGKLHGGGFRHSPRLHDFLYRIEPDCPSMELTMIDVDLKGLPPTPQLCSLTDRTMALAQACFLFFRVGYRTNGPEGRQFLRSYRSALAESGFKSPRGWMRPVCAELDRKLRHLHASSAQRALFPLAPSSLRDASGR
jgi:hypothetical protein